ncbi:MAG: stage V sporulation protein E [Planctomycetes bacterium]|nr:stage V sporulation protein E [Planctomycetota bacterium]
MATPTTPPSRSEFDRSVFLLLASVLTLLALGVVMVFSATAVEASGTGTGGSPLRPLFTHGLKVLVGIGLLFAASRIDPALVARLAQPVWWLSLVLLALVLVPGIGVLINGSRRWLNTEQMIGFALQPSEIAKLALVLSLAAWVAEVKDVGADFRRTFLPGVVRVLLPAGLILLQTDFGTSLLLATLGFLLLLLAGARIHHLGLLAVLGLPVALLFLWLNPRTEYIFRRIGAFADHHFGEAAAATSGLPTQVDFAESALRVGGLTGVGLGAGRHKLFFLAEGENDFILSVIGEELGFLGTLSVLLLLALLLWSGRRLLLGIRHRFGFFVAAGVLIAIAIQALMNVFVAVHWAPVKGLPLPFVSSGGSSLTMLCVGIGLLLACARHADSTHPRLGPEEADEPLLPAADLPATALADADRAGVTR